MGEVGELRGWSAVSGTDPEIVAVGDVLSTDKCQVLSVRGPSDWAGGHEAIRHLNNGSGGQVFNSQLPCERSRAEAAHCIGELLAVRRKPWHETIFHDEAERPTKRWNGVNATAGALRTERDLATVGRDVRFGVVAGIVRKLARFAPRKVLQPSESAVG